ncbi:hypothetical protein HMPREF7215_0797 [Pyramidobacter piscolens W5455]|uniref:Uncharacterized protein n=1 Tax=Pyramidobacter piscolens W5455 TaxID=352165 RepID=A0ABM9ZV00_9BACT|nr:hypothetical protein HMPREF7215_0797 [Pyramidobacter piscolens W5455]
MRGRFFPPRETETFRGAFFVVPRGTGKSLSAAPRSSAPRLSPLRVMPFRGGALMMAARTSVRLSFFPRAF